MEGGEVYNFAWVWAVILTCLVYSHTIGKNIPQGTTRLLALAPIVCLFLWLPLNLTTLHLGGLTSFFIAWLANFKLLLFAFGKGPLCSPDHDHHPIPLSQFLPMACLPIKALVHDQSSSNLGKPPNFDSKDYPSSQTLEKPYPFETEDQNACDRGTKKGGHKSPLSYAIKVLVFCILLMVYGIEVDMHPQLRMSLYCFHIYFMLELLLGILAVLARTLLVGFDLEPQFDEPYLASSLQDFWGKRWNLMATGILRPTIYHPVRYISTTRLMIPRKWAPLPAVFATFLVSGLLHELIFYYIGRIRPTGEVTCFFVLHGVCLVIEIVIKKALDGRYQIPRIISAPIALGFVMSTSFWLFFPPFMRFKPDVRGCKETVALFEFVRHGKLVSPYDISCPYDL